MKLFQKLFKAQLVILSFAFISSNLRAADLTIEVSGLKNSRGKLQIVVFDQEETYKNYNIKKAYASVSKTIHNGKNTITLHDIPRGDYAISLLHDENNNNQMEMNMSKMPLEGYGTSNANDKYAQLSFRDAQVKILSSNKKVNINVFYMGK